MLLKVVARAVVGRKNIHYFPENLWTVHVRYMDDRRYIAP